LKDPESKVRLSALDAAVRLAPDSAVGWLLFALDDEDGEVRSRAANALGDIGDGRAVEALIKAVRDPWNSVRIAAIEALGKIADSRAVSVLVREVDTGEAGVRRAAVVSLGLIGDRGATKTLVAVLEDERCLSAALEALGNIGDRTVIEPIFSFLGHPTAYSAAARTLRILGEPQWERVVDGSHGGLQRLAGTDDPRIVAALVRALEAEDHGHRATAARLLGEIGDVRAIEPLVRLLRNAKMADDVICASKALGLIGDERAVEPLIAELKCNHYSARCAAARALESIGDRHSRCAERIAEVATRIRAAQREPYRGDSMKYRDVMDL